MDLRSGTPYWRLINRSHVCYPVLGHDVSCEIVIIGGGITGALAAHEMSKHGIDIVVLDKREVGSGSTAACTGLLQYETDMELGDLIARVGEASAVRSYQLGIDAIGKVRNLTSTLGEDCGFAERMSLYLASKSAHLPKLYREFEVRKHFGFDVAFLDELDLRERFALRARGAILSKPAAQVDPLRFTQQLVGAAAARGARIFEQTSIKEIHWVDGGVEVITQYGPRVYAKRILFAAGYESLDYLDHKVGQLHSTYALASEPMRECRELTSQCLIWETARPYFYLRNTMDGRIIIGGMDTDFKSDRARAGMIPKITKRLEHRFEELCPGTKLDVRAAWAGIFGDTKDGLAYIGTPSDHPNAYFALGYGGNGITFSMVAAQILTDLYLGRPNPDAHIFRFGR